MKPQLHVGGIAPTEQLILPVTNWEIVKPRGGFWTSSYIGERNGSDWVQWCMGQSFRIPKNKHWHSWLLYPKQDAKVYEIDGYDDLVRLMIDAKVNPFAEAFKLAGKPYSSPFVRLDDSPFHRSHPEFDFHDRPDFEKIALTYDGINLTHNGQSETRFSTPNLYGWDCESTLWFRWIFDKVEYLGETAYKD